MTCSERAINIMGYITLLMNFAQTLGSIIILSKTSDPFSNNQTQTMAAIILVSFFHYICHFITYVWKCFRHNSSLFTEHNPQIVHYILLVAHIIIIATSPNINSNGSSVPIDFEQFFQFTYVYNIIHLILNTSWIVYMKMFGQTSLLPV